MSSSKTGELLGPTHTGESVGRKSCLDPIMAIMAAIEQYTLASYGLFVLLQAWAASVNYFLKVWNL